MDISAIRDEAPHARRQLMEGVERRCLLFGVEEGAARDARTIEGRVLSADERQQREELLRLQDEIGHDELVERAAYTWFDRLLAIRFMEANDRLPSHVRVLSARDGSFDPECLHEALDLPLPALDQAEVASLVAAGDDEALFRAIFLAQCEELAECMPSVFERVRSAMELLLPDGLLAEGGVVEGLVTSIPESDWTQGVEIVGWAYQFYVSERKDEYFASRRKAGRSDIAPATQLFTPEWIVRYLAENSLGRLWMANHPESKLAGSMEYYIAPDGDQASDFRHVGSPDEITVIDPACGSGHMLTYCFDLLASMYEESGYRRRDIPGLILRRNLTGVEIDPRAAALASFALTMKACELDPRFLTRGEHISPRITCLEAVDVTAEELAVLPTVSFSNDLIEDLKHLDEIGSLWEPTPDDVKTLAAAAVRAGAGGVLYAESAAEKLGKASEYATVLSEGYDCVIANPPYMGSGNMNPWLSKWVKTNYKEEKGDLCTCFIKRGMEYTATCGFTALITASSWMFISSFEKLRQYLIANDEIVSMVQLSTHGFPNVTVPTCAFILSAGQTGNKGAYIRLEDFDRPKWQQPRALEAIHNPECGWFYRADQQAFKSIPGWPIAYWVSEAAIRAFSTFAALRGTAAPRQGLSTGDNNRFLRFWWEVEVSNTGFGMKTRQEAKTTGLRWFPCNKGGGFRRWYGNNWYVIDWLNDGESLRKFHGSVIRNPDCYFHEGITWGTTGSALMTMRFSPKGFISEHKGSTCFSRDHGNLIWALGFSNSTTALTLLKVLAPTIDFGEGAVGSLPLCTRQGNEDSLVARATNSCIDTCKTDWDSFETSWDFTTHPLAQPGEPLIERQFVRWQTECRKRFDMLKANEEELNRIFARIYHMEDEVPIEVPDDKVSVRLADRGRDVRSLVSYAVGCMLGRYSLDVPGLVLADQGDGMEGYIAKVPSPTFMPDADGILPITDDEYFDDDVVAMFVRFLEAAYGRESLDANLRYVADSLGSSGSPKKVIRDYFVNQFYVDHCSTYSVPNGGKRPIYWMLSSGPKGGFRALFYIHRYTPDFLARVRTDYVHEQQERYRSRIAELERQRSGAAHGQMGAIDRELRGLRAKLEETNRFEERLHHLADQMMEIDLDDGVKKNYEKLRDVLADIR